MTTLVEFLTARLDEDAAVATTATSGPWHVTQPYFDAGSVENSDVNIANESGHGDIELADAEHIARHDPARVLADVTAKQRIVELHSGGHECSVYDRGEVDNCRWCLDGDECSTLQLLATPYADHPDFDPAWRC